MSDNEENTVYSGTYLVNPVPASSVGKNWFVALKGFPCRIIDMSTYDSKIHFVGIDIFTSKKYEEICPDNHNLDVPDVNRTDYSLLDIKEGFLNLLTSKGETKNNLKLPEGEIGDQIKQMFDEGKDVVISVLSAMGLEGVVAFKEAVGK